ncbi:MAG: hypothetical protein IKF39_01100 [Oscillospiraceae bacterium]|nr:hypothetical protein [Oscillospiraceae bacterium]
MYTRKKWITRAGVVVEEFHSARYQAPGDHRGPRKKPTPEQVKKNNQREKEKKIRLLLLENFSPMDYHTILTYRKDERPGRMEECKADLQKMLRKLRAWYRKNGKELLWMANIERGKRGAWHIHIIVNRIDGTDVQLSKLWEFGRPKNVLIEDTEGMGRLAAYIAKRPEDDEGEENARSFSRSRNLRIPEEHKKHYLHWKTWNRQKIRVPEGYYLGKESYKEWEDCFGYPHREYTLFRIPPGG